MNPKLITDILQLAFLKNLTSKPNGVVYSTSQTVWVRWDNSEGKPDLFNQPAQGDTLVGIQVVAKDKLIAIRVPENPAFLQTTAGG